jgi:hypothetical protein
MSIGLEQLNKKKKIKKTPTVSSPSLTEITPAPIVTPTPSPIANQPRSTLRPWQSYELGGEISRPLKTRKLLHSMLQHSLQTQEQSLSITEPTEAIVEKKMGQEERLLLNPPILPLPATFGMVHFLKYLMKRALF